MRDEQARLMGYRNFAKVREEELTMTTEKALDFLDSMRGVLTELGQREIQSLKSAKATELGTTSVDNFFLWDRRYYVRKIQEEKFKVNQELLSEYFPFEQCLEKMLLVQGLLFGVEFVRYPTAFPDLIWHPDVKVYAVWDVTSEGKRDFLGYLYFDVFPREFKYGHKGHFTLQPGFTKEDGSRHYPCAVFMGNYSPPSANRPSLLKYAEVVSCFHEIGHSLHNLLSKTKFARFHGTAVPRDFVEVPSIMLEHVFWNKEIIRFISGRYDTDENLPYEMIDQLIAGRFADEGLGSLTNLLLSTYALKIHTQDTHEAVCNLNLALEFNKMRKETCMMSGPEDLGLGFDAVHSFCRYRFPVGYATSYYAYLFADAISYDIFETKFRPLLPSGRPVECIEDIATPELREEFRRYREIVLQPGGSHASCLGALGIFLGREPNAGAWLQALRESISTF
ncbi:Saccharolysin [Cladobotryum mycophilum]|uniref:Saccharolysin n=1 Tax=Cladobotryum mycophilum TaxID=491253 RepID=A0ABR0SS60_9HYPO